MRWLKERKKRKGFRGIKIISVQVIQKLQYIVYLSVFFSTEPCSWNRCKKSFIPMSAQSAHSVYIWSTLEANKKKKKITVLWSILYLSWIILPLKCSTRLSYHLLHAFLILSSPTRNSLRLQAHFMLYQPVSGVCPYDFRKIPQHLWYFLVTAVFKGSLILEHCITFAFNRGYFFF